MSEEQVTEVSDVQDSVQEVAQSGDWRDAIPEEVRGHRSLEHINDVGALAKSYVHAQSMIGADKIAIPGKSATPEDWREVYSKLGAPQDAEGYELTHNLPEGVETDTEMMDWFKGAAYEAGLTPMQAQALADQWNSLAAEGTQMQETEYANFVQNVESELRKEYGQAFDDKLALGNGVIEQFGSPELLEVQLADGTLLGDNPDVIRLMASIGTFMQERLGEDTLEGVKTDGAMTPDQARDKLSELTAQGSPYWDQRHPEHHWYINEALKFREMMNG